MKINTPNKVIGLRALLGYSQAQFAAKLGYDKSSIQRIETSRKEISKLNQLAFLGLLYEESDSIPELLDIYTDLDCDSLVEFLQGKESANGRLRNFTYPVCAECESYEIDIIKDYGKGTYGYDCRHCGDVKTGLRNLNLARIYQIRTYKKINLMSERWYP